MSIDTNYFVGPYVRVKIKVEKQLIDHCKDHSCKPEDKFCPQCGLSKKGRYGETWMRVPNVIFYDLIGDALTSADQVMEPEVQISSDGKCYRMYQLLPNSCGKNCPMRKFFLGDHETSQEISPSDITVEARWFADHFHDALEKLYATFGQSNVRLVWGTVVWYN